MQISDKVFVVTGAGNGIGREVVLRLIAGGARVAAVDLSEEGLAETQALAGAGGEQVSLHPLNVTDRAAVMALPDQVVEAHGSVDGVVNVAGIIQPFVPFAELAYEQMERVFAVNYWGTSNMCEAFLPHLLARPAASLVNVASMGALVPVPGQSVYGASKAAVKHLTEGLYAELQGTDVAVTNVVPGGVATNITGNSGVDIPGQASTDDAPTSLTSPDEAGRLIVEGIETGAYRVLIGKDAKMLDRLSRLSPKRATELVAKKMASLLET